MLGEKEASAVKKQHYSLSKRLEIGKQRLYSLNRHFGDFSFEVSSKIGVFSYFWNIEDEFYNNIQTLRRRVSF